MGLPRVIAVNTVEDFAIAFQAALQANELTTLVVKVEAKGPDQFVTDLTLLENRVQFQRHLRTLGK